MVRREVAERDRVMGLARTLSPCSGVHLPVKAGAEMAEKPNP